MAFNSVERKRDRGYYEEIFIQLDKNGDGRIDNKDLETMLSPDADNEVTRKIVTKLRKYFDKNKDGIIDMDKFIDIVHDRNIKQLFGHYVNNYVNFIVPPNKRHEFIPIDRRTDGRISEPQGPYEDSMSCWPPPVGMVIMSLFEIACFVVDEVTQPESAKYGDGAVAQLLIYDPYKRIECWRFLTYMFIHIGYQHIVLNLIYQLLLGIPLEMVNPSWRVMTVYFAGVVAGSLLTSITDPVTYLAGASGGVYAIITAHLANIFLNWKEMSFRAVVIQVIGFTFFITYDVGMSIYNRYVLLERRIVAGLLVGIWVLKNMEPTEKEKYLWWAAFIAYILLMGTAIMLNIFWTGHFLKST